MEKPINLKVKEIEEQIAKIINASGIPAFIIKPSFEKILKQLEVMEQQEYVAAKKAYEESLKEESEKNGTKQK